MNKCSKKARQGVIKRERKRAMRGKLKEDEGLIVIFVEFGFEVEVLVQGKDSKRFSQNFARFKIWLIGSLNRSL